MAKEKDLSIETLRGLAILLVVAGYILRADIAPLGKTYPSLSVSLLNAMEYTLSTIRMPLFTVISGFLYAMSPATRETLGRLFRGKFRRVMIPYITLTTFQHFLLPSYYPVNHFYQIYFFPEHQLWFLFSIFNIFLMIGLIDACGGLETPRRFLAVCAAAIASHILFEMPRAFSLFGVNYLLPFFLLGYGIRRYSQYLNSARWLVISFSIFLVSFFFKPFYYTVFHQALPFHALRILGIIVAFSGIPILFKYRQPVPWLAYFGYYSLGIHLFHRLSVSAVRSTFAHFQIHDAVITFSVLMAGGVFIALLMHFVCDKFSLTRRLVLGMNKQEKPPQLFPAKERLKPRPINNVPVLEEIPARSA